MTTLTTHPQVAGVPPAQRRHAGAADDQRLVRLRPSRDLELDRAAVDGLDLDGRAERRLRRGDVDRGHEIVAVAHEPRILANANQHVQVAGRSAAVAGVAAAGDPDPLAVGDAGGDVDLDLRALDLAAPPLQTLHGSRATLPSPWQTSQAVVRIIWPNGVRDTARSWPLPWQRGHVSIGVPGSAPLPRQCSHSSTAS